MKKLSALLAIFILLSTAGTSSAQQFTLQLNGGYSLPLPALKGDLPTISGTTYTNPDSNTYQQKTGFNFGLTGKYAFDKKFNHRITFAGGYQMFSNSGDYTMSGGSYSIKPKINVIVLGIGYEYAVINKKSNFIPYFGLDVNANIFGGETKTTFTPTSGTASDSVYNLASATRLGFSIGAGFDYMFSKQFGINVGAKWNWKNVIGKDADTSALPWTSVDQPLNDKEYIKNGQTWAAKNIMDIQFYAGVSFYFGRTFKKK